MEMLLLFTTLLELLEEAEKKSASTPESTPVPKVTPLPGSAEEGDSAETVEMCKELRPILERITPLELRSEVIAHLNPILARLHDLEVAVSNIADIACDLVD